MQVYWQILFSIMLDQFLRIFELIEMIMRTWLIVHNYSLDQIKNIYKNVNVK